MSELVIETKGLRKVYRGAGRRIVAVDGLDLEVPAGGVHGFLGPNGSGKTTTIRMLVGLARPTRGEIRLFGEPVPARLSLVVGRVGAVVEQPAFVPRFSGRKNLTLLARAAGVPRTAVDSALRTVGLADRSREHVEGYSLGMRQRLAIAASLLKDPDLLILDEPTNGLDPEGIHAIRDLIRELGEAGVTVLLSSHILTEVQQVCHSVSILGEGRMLASGRVEDLLGEKVARARVVVVDPLRAQQVLEGAGYAVERRADSLVVEGTERPEELTELLAASGIYVREINALRPTLESYFLTLTGRRSDPADSDETDEPAEVEQAERTGPTEEVRR